MTEVSGYLGGPRQPCGFIKCQLSGSPCKDSENRGEVVDTQWIHAHTGKRERQWSVWMVCRSVVVHIQRKTRYVLIRKRYALKEMDPNSLAPTYQLQTVISLEPLFIFDFQRASTTRCRANCLWTQGL